MGKSRSRSNTADSEAAQDLAGWTLHADCSGEIGARHPWRRWCEVRGSEADTEYRTWSRREAVHHHRATSVGANISSPSKSALYGVQTHSLIRKIPSGWTRTYIFIEYLLVSHYWKLLNLNLLFERRYVLKRAHEPRTWVES